MEDEFTLTIRLGNEAMQTSYDVAVALRCAASKLEREAFHPGHTETILDGNGSRVGGFRMPPYST